LIKKKEENKEKVLVEDFDWFLKIPEQEYESHYQRHPLEMTPAYIELQGSDLIKFHLNIQTDITLEKKNPNYKKKDLKEIIKENKILPYASFNSRFLLFELEDTFIIELEVTDFGYIFGSLQKHIYTHLSYDQMAIAKGLLERNLTRIYYANCSVARIPPVAYLRKNNLDFYNILVSNKVIFEPTPWQETSIKGYQRKINRMRKKLDWDLFDEYDKRLFTLPSSWESKDTDSNKKKFWDKFMKTFNAFGSQNDVEALERAFLQIDETDAEIFVGKEIYKKNRNKEESDDDFKVEDKGFMEEGNQDELLEHEDPQKYVDHLEKEENKKFESDEDEDNSEEEDDELLDQYLSLQKRYNTMKALKKFEKIFSEKNQ